MGTWEQKFAWAKNEADEAKISTFFSQKGVLWTDFKALLLEMWPLRTTGETWNGDLQGRPHIPIHPAPLGDFTVKKKKKKKKNAKFGRESVLYWKSIMIETKCGVQ